jgi:hypothetical protein
MIVKHDASNACEHNMEQTNKVTDYLYKAATTTDKNRGMENNIPVYTVISN